MRIKLILLAIGLMAGSAAVQASDHAPHWEYKGKAGATHWGDLEDGFASCKLGKEQSPIDIRGAKKAKLDPIGFQYTPGAAEVVNNGHTVQVNLESGGTIKLADGEYKLLQFHFHTPSEEKINGKSYPLVAHLVHKNADGNLAVVAVLFKLGKENAALKQVFASLPAKAGDKTPLEGGINLESVLPEQRGYYAFKGSLTTPPCSEGVRWQVMKTVSEISGKQLAAFKKLYAMNARPTQPLNGRALEVSE
jgi:carbonic anhydrase